MANVNYCQGDIAKRSDYSELDVADPSDLGGIVVSKLDDLLHESTTGLGQVYEAKCDRDYFELRRSFGCVSADETTSGAVFERHLTVDYASDRLQGNEKYTLMLSWFVERAGTMIGPFCTLYAIDVHSAGYIDALVDRPSVAKESVRDRRRMNSFDADDLFTELDTMQRAHKLQVSEKHYA